MPGHTKCCTCHAKSSLKICCSKMQPLSGNQRPDLLTSLKNMSFALRVPRKMHLCRSSSNVPRPPSFLEILQNPHVLPLLTRSTIPCACHVKRHLNVQKWREHVVFSTFWLRNVLCATTACTFSTSQLPKVVRTWCVLCILTSKCALRHNSVHFFDISTSKSGPNLVCFVRFDFDSLRATTACTFSTSQLLKVLRSCGALHILTWKCASRHNGVQFFISHLASWLRTRRFSEPTFRPSRASNHWKNTLFHDFATFSRSWIFFLLTLSLSSSLLFSDSSHLCFSSVHIVGSLTSKLPSITVFL